RWATPRGSASPTPVDHYGVAADTRRARRPGRRPACSIRTSPRSRRSGPTTDRPPRRAAGRILIRPGRLLLVAVALAGCARAMSSPDPPQRRRGLPGHAGGDPLGADVDHDVELSVVGP